MKDGIEFNIEGLDALRQKFSTVSAEMEGKGANAAAKAAARLIARAAHANAMRLDDEASPAEIAKNIWLGGAKYPGVRKKGKRYSPSDGVAYRVGVAGGAGGRSKKNAPEFERLPGLDTRHWRFWEFGSENTPARPLLRAALNDNLRAATNEFVKEFDKALGRAVKKRDKLAAKRSRFQTSRRQFFGID